MTDASKLAKYLFDLGDPGFVDALRRVEDADALGDFAAEWYADPRPLARRYMADYLDRPLNAFRHEALVKRLFKLAEAAADDEIMGRFLALFDRSVRRTRAKVSKFDRKTKKFEEGEVGRVTTPVMPKYSKEQLQRVDDDDRKRFLTSRLFSLNTRNYLRRRAWRYFRQLGKRDPERYRAAMMSVLPLYRHEDVGDGLALIDNWGLTHALFHHSTALLANPTGWTLKARHKLAEVQAAPYFPEVWQADAQPLFTLLDAARCRPVRVWATQLLRKHHKKALKALPLDRLVGWLGHRSADVVRFAGELLRERGGLAELGTDRLMKLLDEASPESMEVLAELLGEAFKPGTVSVRQAVQLAKHRTSTVAQLGLRLLEGAELRTEAECRSALDLAEAESDHLRPALVRWACTALSRSPAFRPTWAVELLDSRFADVRREGWAWLEAEPRVRDEPAVWQQLVESPFDNVRLRVIEHLEKQSAGVGVPALRLLWATVLLNVARGAKTKPWVLKQLTERLLSQPAEAEELLPLLGVALRSLRGPEFRAGIVGVTAFLKRHPASEPLVRRLFPEMRPAELVTAG